MNGQSVTVSGVIVFPSDEDNVLSIGQHIESVEFRPNDKKDYSVVDTTVTINVIQATPKATVQPIDIIYGTALSNTQLNGQASARLEDDTVGIPGTFVYTSRGWQDPECRLLPNRKRDIHADRQCRLQFRAASNGYRR